MAAPVTWTQVAAAAGLVAAVVGVQLARWVAAGMPGARERR